MRSNTIIVTGSHGELVVHRSTGVVVEGLEECGCEDCVRYGTYEEQVALFDPNDIAAFDGEVDILRLGFWDRSGVYTPAVEHLMVHHPSGWEDVDAVSEKRLLPKPDVEVCLHGFTEDEQGQHYSDDPDEITGWCVYLRRNEPAKGSHPVMSYFDREWKIIDEWDFGDSGAARAFAKRMAADYGTTIFAY